MKHLLSLVLLTTCTTAFAATSPSLDEGTTKCVLLCDSTVTAWVDDEKKKKEEYTRDERGNVIHCTRYNWKDGEWVIEANEIITRSDDGLPISIEFKGAKKETEEKKVTYTDSVVTVIHNVDTVPSNAPETGDIYDDQGNVTGNIYSCKIDGEWFYTKNVYYNSDSAYGHATYNWKNGVWVGWEKTETILDNQHNVTCRNVYKWANGDWFLFSKDVYNYDDWGNEKSVLTYSRDEAGTSREKKDNQGRSIHVYYWLYSDMKLKSEEIYYYSMHTINVPNTEDDVNAVSSDEIKASSKDGMINLKGLNEGDTVNFYTIDGILFATRNSTDGSASCQAPNGSSVVIAKVGNRSIKISVK